MEHVPHEGEKFFALIRPDGYHVPPMKKCSADTVLQCSCGQPLTAKPVVRRRPRPIARIRRGSGTAAKVTIGGVISVLIVLAVIGLRVGATASRIMGRTVVNETTTIPADGDYSGGVEVQGTVSYTFTVTAHDGEAQMLFGPIRNPDNPTHEEILRLLGSARRVGAAATETMSGSISTGTYVWAIYNPNDKRPVRISVKFNGR
jgi:hypothetical protein